MSVSWYAYPAEKSSEHYECTFIKLQFLHTLYYEYLQIYNILKQS